MRFPTFLVESKVATLTPESATPLGEVEYAEWPYPNLTVKHLGKPYVVFKAPAEGRHSRPPYEVYVLEA